MKVGRVAMAAAIAIAAVSVARGQTWNANFQPNRVDSNMTGMQTSLPVEMLLSRTIEFIDWEDITFEEVLDWLRAQADGQVNIIPRWNALNQEGVDRDTTVTLKLYNTTVHTILTELLEEFSARSGNEVTFRGKGNTLRISSLSDFNRKLELRVYDVSDILFRVPDFSQSAPQVDLNRRSGGGGGGGGGSQPVFSSSGGQSQDELSEEGDQDPEEILDDLVTMIENTVAPLSWDTNGGIGRVRGYAKRSIIVLNTIDVHEQIAGYFSLSR